MELYKQYRPATLDEVVGNKATVKAIRQMLDSEKMPKAILFHGPSGCGKTTLARILKTELGCKDLDFIEMNSASYRGIDSMRELAARANLHAIGDCKIYLLDEVHGLTKDAQNALLKTLEDTPPRTYFILCTTDPSKLIAALKGRCTSLEVKLLKDDEMRGLLKSICKKEKIEISDDIMSQLITVASGGVRRAIVLLDKIRHLEEDDQAEAIAGGADEGPAEVVALCRALLNGGGNWKAIADILKEIKEEPETVRLIVLGYMNSVLLKSGKDRAFQIIQSFSQPFYDNGGRAMLTGSCYEVICGQ